MALVKLWFLSLVCLFVLFFRYVMPVIIARKAVMWYCEKSGNEIIFLSSISIPTPTVRLLCQHHIIRKPVLLTFQTPTENAVDLLRSPYLQDLFNKEVG